MFILLFVSGEKFSFLKEIVTQINTLIKRQFNDESKIKILNTCFSVRLRLEFSKCFSEKQTVLFV